MASKFVTYLTDTKERGKRITNNMVIDQVEEDTDDKAYVKDRKLKIEEKKVSLKTLQKENTDETLLIPWSTKEVARV